MPEKWLSFFRSRKIRRRSYKKDKFRLSDVNWLRLSVIVGGIAVAVMLGVFGWNIHKNRQQRETLPEGLVPTASSSAGTPTATVPGSTPPLMDGKTEATALDLSEEVVTLKTKEKRINTPSFFNEELVYSAGSGSLDLPVLKTLYTYDLLTDKEKKITKAVVKDGEIYETVMNENWIIWVDTDQQGTNQIYCIDRNDTKKDPVLIKECDYTVPKLRLSRDVLLFSEQNEMQEERLYIVDLVTGEDLSIMDFTDSIQMLPDNYGVSSPDIYGDLIVWAAPNPKQTKEDILANGEKSVIYELDLNKIWDENYHPPYFDPDMYVHEPVTNGTVLAWIDKNKAPDSKLYLKVGDEIILVSEGVTTYALGNGFVAYGHDSQVYIYNYETRTYGRVTAPGKKGILPIVSGYRVVFFDLDSTGKDTLRSVIIK
ncbi:MAG: hypothetical protein II781_04450 [Clostridia bacterium]|nr:hypothetical protein [Clostridia bacterium]